MLPSCHDQDISKSIAEQADEAVDNTSTPYHRLANQTRRMKSRMKPNELLVTSSSRAGRGRALVRLVMRAARSWSADSLSFANATSRFLQ
jgi:hypothetical protein